MKLLLTSNGLSNESIAKALEDLVGKPRKNIKIAFIPTAAFPEDDAAHESRDWLIDDMYRIKEFCEFIDIVSISDLSNEDIVSRLEYADVLFVGGGNTFYLSYCMQKAGLFEVVPRLLETRVYAGISAGSMLATASLRSTSQAITNTEAFLSGNIASFGPLGQTSTKTLQLVDIALRPHINKFKFGGTNDFLEKIAQDIKVPLYAIDDSTALKIVDGNIEVITKGTWQLFN